MIFKNKFIAIVFTAMLIMLSTASIVDTPASGTADASGTITQVALEPEWWDDTLMDRDGNHMHDALDIALEQDLFIENGRIGVLVDFDHLPTTEDEQALRDAVDFEPRFRFHHINIISGWVPVERISELLDVPGVVFLTHNSEVRALMDGSRSEHHVEPQVWDMGYKGEGVAVAIIDTGIDGKHLGLDDFDDNPATYDPKIVAFYDAIGAPDVTDGSTEPYDDHGHGSHCAGITSGTGDGSDGKKYAGMAPAGSLVGVKVLDGAGSGSFDQVMAGMEWTIDNQEKFNIRAASMSLGGVWLIELTQQQEERLTHLANEMVAHGIALCIAAGNSGTYGSIGTPGAAKDVITVGATEHDRELAIYSSKGPTHEGEIKPNVAAIGSNVWSVQANSYNGYTSMSGTSMATPNVAGMAALMLQANPDLHPLMVRSIMESTSEFRWLSHPVRPNNDYGWGFVEADAAMVEVVNTDPNLNISIDAETPTITFTEEFTDDEGNNHTVNRTLYKVELGENMTFHVEGNATHIEWRNVDLSDTWHEIEAVDGEWLIPFNDVQFNEESNVSLWVRAKGADGVSAPVYIHVHVHERSASSEDDDIAILTYLIPTMGIMAAVVIGYIIGRKKLEEDSDDESAW